MDIYKKDETKTSDKFYAISSAAFSHFFTQILSEAIPTQEKICCSTASVPVENE